MPIIFVISVVAAFLMQLFKEGISQGLIGEKPLTQNQAVTRIVIDAIVYIGLLTVGWNLAAFG